MRMLPAEGASSPAQARAKVVLPAPFWPQTAWMRWGAKARPTSQSGAGAGEGRFAGAVLAADRMDALGREGEADIGKRGEIAKADGEPFAGQRRFSRRGGHEVRAEY
jgi:hypothetical protein